MTDELLELARLRADLPPADEAAMARARATLVHTVSSAPARRHRSPWRIAATATAGAAAVAGFLLVPGASDNAPTASAVTLNNDGTVTIELTDITDMSAANNVLEGAGIRAELINYQDKGTCAPGTQPATSLPYPDGLFVAGPRNAGNILTFRPDQIPAGAELVVLGSTGSVRPETGQVVPVVMVAGAVYPEDSGTCVDFPDTSPLNVFPSN